MSINAGSTGCSGSFERERLQHAVEVIEVVDDPPVSAALLDAGAPLIEAVEVEARIEVVAAQLGDVERDDVEALQVERDVAHVALGELFLHVGEDQDLLAPSV